MEEVLYDFMNKNDDKYWWGVARKNIIETIMRKYVNNIDNNPALLDAGCGAGGNFSFLSKFTNNIVGLEYNLNEVQIAEQRTGFKVYHGAFPNNIPFENSSFDLITMFDALEHIDEDIETLNIIHSKLKSNGYLILTVPAFNFLWGKFDEINLHKRRYSLKELKIKVKQAGFDIKYSSYFNFILFPIIAFIRIADNILPIFKDEVLPKMPPKFINSALTQIMSFEKNLLTKAPLPWGVSIIMVCAKS